MPNANVIFLPWARQGAAANIPATDTLTANQSSRVALPVQFQLNNQPVNMPVRLFGPGEVTGLDTHQIVRTDPRNGTVDFEPNYFAAIEFDRPDFPWLFTPTKADAEGRLRPWLCLMVVKKQPGVTLRTDRILSQSVLEIIAPARPGDELPDLSESWAWTHTQLSCQANATPAELTDILKKRPELSVSRLLCPRRLQPSTEYLACVVPTFELGRKAGLNLPIMPADEAKLDPAWLAGAQAPANVKLPVYYHWEFRTGVEGDFESLVALLASRPVPPEVGKRPMDITHPGFPLPPQIPNGATLGLEGALQPLNSTPTDWPVNQRQAFQGELKKIINAPAQIATDPNSTPLLAPPIYGRWHAARNQVGIDGTVPTWLDDLNLDPRHRVTAGIGTQVIQEQQEQLMASAWEQLGEIERANQRLRQAQLSVAVNGSLHVRVFSRLSQDALLQVIAPAQARLAWPDATAPTVKMTLQQRIRVTAVPAQAVSSPLRRLARPRGVISRRIVTQGGVRTGALISKLNIQIIAKTLPNPTGLATFNQVSESIVNLSPNIRYENATDSAVSTMRGRPLFHILSEGDPMPNVTVRIAGPDSADATNFRKAAIAHLAKVNPAKIGFIFARRLALPATDVQTAVLRRLNPALTIKARTRAFIPNVDNQPSQVDPLEPILAVPEFPQPMYEALRDLSQDFLLPGLAFIPPNTVTLLKTNARFIEAFLVGLNTEMARELLWRDFPTDQRGTYFRQFWDTRGSGTQQPDIGFIHGWGNKTLGSNVISGGVDNQLVLLIRGELLRRYPTAVIYAAKAVMNNGRREPGTEERYPVFRGTLQPDVTFIGFNLPRAEAIGNPGWFFVIQEQPTEPRFGFDVGTDFGVVSHVSVKAAPPAVVVIPANARWGKNSAHMAFITRQQPVRIAIHATKMV